MTTVGTKPGHGRVRSASASTPAERETLRGLKRRFAGAPVCSFCRKNSNHVKFVITDPANRNNVCESCADACVRRFACTCVC
jgi:hypothetical protein